MGKGPDIEHGSCDSCRYWHEIDGEHDEHWGECRRYPPRREKYDCASKMVMGQWPQTWDNYWCGEWNK